MHTYTHTCVRTNMHTHTHTYTHAHIHTYIRIHTYILTYMRAEFGAPASLLTSKWVQCGTHPKLLKRRHQAAGRAGSKAGQQGTAAGKVCSLLCKVMFRAHHAMHYICIVLVPKTLCPSGQGDGVGTNWALPAGDSNSLGVDYFVLPCGSVCHFRGMSTLFWNTTQTDRQTDAQVWRAGFGSPVSLLKTKWAQGQQYPKL